MFHMAESVQPQVYSFQLLNQETAGLTSQLSADPCVSFLSSFAQIDHFFLSYLSDVSKVSIIHQW